MQANNNNVFIFGICKRSCPGVTRNKRRAEQIILYNRLRNHIALAINFMVTCRHSKYAWPFVKK
jgi:hypothetical protein